MKSQHVSLYANTGTAGIEATPAVRTPASAVGTIISLPQAPVRKIKS